MLPLQPLAVMGLHENQAWGAPKAGGLLVCLVTSSAVSETESFLRLKIMHGQ